MENEIASSHRYVRDVLLVMYVLVNSATREETGCVPA